MADSRGASCFPRFQFIADEISMFDFAPQVYDHPDLTVLCDLYKRGAINKYDLPILEPLAQNASSGTGVKESELATITRLIAKYKSCR